MQSEKKSNHNSKPPKNLGTKVCQQGSDIQFLVTHHMGKDHQPWKIVAEIQVGVFAFFKDKTVFGQRIYPFRWEDIKQGSIELGINRRQRIGLGASCNTDDSQRKM